MASIKITQSEFKINGVRYFRTKSEDVELCSYGKKEAPVFGSNFLVVRNKIHKDVLASAPIKIGEPVTVDWSKASKAEINANVKYLSVDGKMGLTLEKARSASLKLVKISIDYGLVIEAINQVDDALQAMKLANRRIVTDIWIAVEATLAEKVSTEATVKVTATGLQLVIGANATNTSASKVVLGKGTTFAYLLMKASRFNRTETKVEDLEVDQQGMG